MFRKRSPRDIRIILFSRKVYTFFISPQIFGLIPSPDLLADLMLFYVETGVQFTNDFGDINETFYSSIESTYLAVLKLIRNEGLLDKFSDRARKVVNDTIDIGWGFHDDLFDVYYQFYDDE